jgi:8-oxo-dGTP pyrophosphatase MutT (NUDIX family)
MNENELKLLKANLPKSPGVQGREKYLNSAVLVPLVMLNGEYHLLFEKRSSTIPQGDEICFPGGRYDPEQDASCEDAALRETAEELGIGKDKIEVEGRFDTVVASMGAAVDPFLGILKIQAIDELSIDPREVQKVFTLPVAYFERNKPETYFVRLEVQPSYVDENGARVVLFPGKELGLPSKYHQPWGGKKFRIFVYKTPEGVIWGLTAEIVHELIKHLRQTTASPRR